MTQGAERRRVPDIGAIGLFRERPGVWLTFAGSAFLLLYAERLGDLKPSWVTALAIAAEHPGITQTALGRALRINRASSMALATALEGHGLLSRDPRPGRKRTALQITELGRRRLEEACAIEDELVAATMGDFTPDELARFVASLKRVAEIASSAPA